MRHYGRHFEASELGSKFVVIDRELWRQESATAITSLVGRSLLHSVHDTREEAEAEAVRANDSVRSGDPK